MNAPDATLQIIRKGKVKYALAATESFIAEVKPGETFEVETELNIGGHLITRLDEKLSAKDVTLPFVNPATGPVRLAGAKPGDMVVVDVLDVGVHGLGFTALWPGIGIFPDWCRKKEFGIQNRNVVVENGIVHWSDTLKLEAKPMIGVIGVAPVAGGMLTIDNGTHGGNLDIQEVTNGNRVMFPVYHEGAYLYFGDVHALQGDAECNGMGAIEIRGHLRLRVDIKPAPQRMTWPRIETPTHICTVGCARPLDDALRIAFEEMVYWLEEGYGIPGPEAYMLLGQVAEARCTQMVNPKYTYICKVNKKLLPRR
ncbi:MAG TPA: acetamidase/formamidase family protein [Rhodanobacteraceae bacterium]|nr:acetamidase/formamidase family protein [Rhodanobacteraceae bacterium]